MADEVISLDLLINQSESANSVAELKKSIKDLKNASIEAAAAGNEALANSYTKAAGAATDRIDDLNKKVKALASDTKGLDSLAKIGNTIAGGFGAAQGAVGLFGSAGKDLQETLVKVQSAQLLLNGAQQVGNFLTDESVGKFKLLKLAFAGLGIGALLLAVEFLANNFDKVKQVLKNIIPESVQKAFTFLKDSISDLVDGVKNFVGLGDKVQGTGNLFKGVFDNFKKVNEEGKKKLAEYNEKLKEQIDYLKKLSDSGEPGSLGRYNFLLSESNNRLDELTPGTKKYNDELKKNIELQKESDALALQRKILEGTPDELKQKTAPVKENTEVIAFKQTQEQLTAILSTESKNRRKITDQEKSVRIQAISDTLTTIQNLTELFSGKGLRAQKRAFEINKQASAAKALIDTFSSAQAAFKSLADIPVVGPVLGAAAAAAAITAGLLNVKKIESQKFEGGSSASGGSFTAPSIGGSGGNISVPNINQPTTNLEGGSQQNDTRVYVLETDIKKVGARVQTIENRALIH